MHPIANPAIRHTDTDLIELRKIRFFMISSLNTGYPTTQEYTTIDIGDDGLFNDGRPPDI